MKKEETIVQKHKKNFETLYKAFQNNHVALVECTVFSTKEKVAVICAKNIEEGGYISFVPFAIMINGNPYNILAPKI